MKQTIITLLILLQSAILFAQQVKVLSASDLQPISNCLIYNASKAITATTNARGIADISSFRNTDSLIFKHLSFTQATIAKTDVIAKNNTVYLTTAVIRLEEVVFSANKVEEKYSDLPVKVDILEARQIQSGNPQTSADLLQQSGKVFVQTSQLGG